MKEQMQWIRPEEIEARSMETVSYTHLDVYKRQVHDNAYASGDQAVPDGL